MTSWPASTTDLSALRRLRAAALGQLRPPPNLSLPDWIESEIRLPADVSALPGPMRLYAYQSGIADAIGDPKLERVTIIKSARIGYTALLTATVASYVANDPCPIIVLLPTEKDTRSFVVSDLEPTIAATPAVSGLMRVTRDRDGRNTLTARRFPGGSLKILPSRSPRNLRAHTARVLLIDEADAMEDTAEGDPITLAEKRTLSYPDRKIIMGSTPLYEATSKVLRAYAESDQRVFEIPCPHCGDHFELRWANITWPEGRPAAAHAVCPACGGVILESAKRGLVDSGRWRPTAPEVTGHAGFRINALVSTLTNATWGKLAAEFLRAKKSPATLRVFVNTVLGEVWREEQDDTNESELFDRREPIGVDRIPVDVLALTAGVDVQNDRLESTLIGWDRDGTPYVLEHEMLWGNPQEEPVWQALDEWLGRRLPHPLGGSLRIERSLIDAGDGNVTARVYAYAFARANRGVYACKGADGTRVAVEMSKSSAVRGGRLMIVGVDGIKAAIHARLGRPRLIRFSDSLPLAWFEQVLSERLDTRYRRGRPVRQWVRIPGKRAEALDCTIYAFAARALLTIDPNQRQGELKGIPVKASRPVVSRSAWMQRQR